MWVTSPKFQPKLLFLQVPTYNIDALLMDDPTRKHVEVIRFVSNNHSVACVVSTLHKTQKNTKQIVRKPNLLKSKIGKTNIWIYELKYDI